MPNQLWLCRMCPDGQHPVRSVAGGMGCDQAQTRGVPTRIQPIACSGAAGAASSPVAEEGGVKARAKLKPEGESVQLAPASSHRCRRRRVCGRGFASS